MTKCTFCGREESPHKGIHLIKNIGAVHYYCSKKCKSHAEKLKRDKRKVRWTEAFHITRDKARAREAEVKEKTLAEREAKKEKKQAKAAKR
ncbi:MAG: 50S ribosomal protein L24e [Nanoarchaeota archaeon]|nr:50S ribosomal protein L24e [Nanoarchaeota archaeon]MBU0976909.1 50S ribosomal protein L24e [Nanoarchaeota archaeon]